MRKRLLRLFCLAVCICLVGSCALAELIEAAPDMQEDQDGGFVEHLDVTPNAFLVLRDTLYAQTWSELYYAVENGWQRVNIPWELGSIELVSLAEDGVYALLRQDTTYDETTGMLITPDDGLFALHYLPLGEDGKLGEPERRCKLSWDVDEESWPQLQAMVTVDGAVYILLHDDQTDWENNSLYRVDPATGAGTLVMKDYVSNMIPYKDGLLLARRFVWKEAYDERGRLIKLPDLVSIDPATGETNVLCTLPDTNCGGLTYDAATDALYYADSTFVYRYDSGFTAAEAVGYMISANMGRSDQPAVIYRDRYYTTDWRDESYIVSATIDPNLLPTRTLRLCNVWGVNDIVRQFAQEHPDVAIEYVDLSGSSAEEYRSHMQSPQAADIYSMNLPYSPYAPLLKYGLLADLSGSEPLMELVGRMYPNLTAAYLRDGKLYGLPVSIYAYTMGYYPDALEKVGLTEDDLPTTYDELLDFLAEWYYDYYDEYEEIQLFEWSPELREAFFSMVFSAQVLSCEVGGERITFRTPTILRLLNRMDSPEMKTVFDALGPQVDGEGVVIYSTFVADAVPSPTALFVSSHDPMPSTYRQWMPTKPLLLRLEEDGDPVIQTNVTLLTVNRASGNQDLAIELLVYIAERLPQDIMTAMIPDENEPIQVSDYEESLAYYRRWLEETERAAAENPEVDYTDSIQWYQDRIARLEGEERWAFSAEDIAYYRENVAPYLVVLESSIFTGEDNPANTAIQLYMEGAKSADFFLSEIDRIVNMMQEENR